MLNKLSLQDDIEVGLSALLARRTKTSVSEIIDYLKSEGVVMKLSELPAVDASPDEVNIFLKAIDAGYTCYAEFV